MKRIECENIKTGICDNCMHIGVNTELRYRFCHLGGSINEKD